jgi:FMN-dependent NADH-azoreductase
VPTLLHLDSSARSAGSVSRRLTADFVRHWRSCHPDGEVVHRDLAVDPLPHVDAAETGLLYRLGQEPLVPPPPSVRLAEQLIAELLDADLLLIGSPMYNFGVGSALKAWIDHVSWPGRTIAAPGADPGPRPAAVVVATRNGGYGPGTPREAFNFHDTHLVAALGLIGIHDVEVVPVELIAFGGPDGMPSPPGGPDLREVADRSLLDAEQRLLLLAQHGGRPAPSAAEWGAPASVRT